MYTIHTDTGVYPSTISGEYVNNAIETLDGKQNLAAIATINILKPEHVHQ